MNNALVAKGGGDSQDDLGDNGNNDEDKANTYGLMIGNPKHQDSNYMNTQQNAENEKKPGMRRQIGAHINQNYIQPKPGQYIQSKQMVFGSSQKLMPNRESNLSKNKNFSTSNSNQDVPTLQNQLVKQYQLQPPNQS